YRAVVAAVVVAVAVLLGGQPPRDLVAALGRLVAEEDAPVFLLGLEAAREVSSHSSMSCRSWSVRPGCWPSSANSCRAAGSPLLLRRRGGLHRTGRGPSPAPPGLPTGLPSALDSRFMVVVVVVVVVGDKGWWRVLMVWLEDV